ncbi:MAG: hypothetical protein ABIQ93_14690 [Saprospiraceae bacterium]
MNETEGDDLKRIWQTDTQRDAAIRHHRPEELLPILKRRSRSTLRAMQMNILLEAILGLGVMAFFWWWSYQVPELRWVCRIAALAFSPLYGFYYRSIRQLQRAENASGSLRDQLRATLLHWESALRLYIRINMALLPPLFLIGAILGAYAAGAMEAVQTVVTQRWYYWLPAVALVTWAMYPLVVWLVRISYGRNLRKLKNCLLELEQPAGDSPDFFQK